MGAIVSSMVLPFILTRSNTGKLGCRHGYWGLAGDTAREVGKGQFTKGL